MDVRHIPDHRRAVKVSVLRRGADRVPTLEEQERQHVLLALEKTGGYRTQAAQILGIDRVSRWRKLKRYGLDHQDPGRTFPGSKAKPTRPHVQHRTTHSRH